MSRIFMEDAAYRAHGGLHAMDAVNADETMNVYRQETGKRGYIRKTTG